MKRLFSMLCAVLLCSGTMVQAQLKVDQEALLKRVTKSDSDIANPKKAAKATLWLDRGNLFVEIYGAPTAGLYRGMDQTAAQIMVGKKPTKRAELNKVAYSKAVYPYFDAYFKNKKLMFWYTTKYIVPDALEKAKDAYLKAYEIDKATEPKVKAGIKKIADFYKEAAGDAFAVGKYKQGAELFKDAYEVSVLPVYGVKDTVSIFNAGMLYATSNMFKEGAECLQKALELGYDNNGETSYYLSHCLMSMDKNNEAEEVLRAAIAKYPKNVKIVENLLNLYSKTGKDANSIVPIVEKAIEADAKNPALYEGLGRIYDKLGDADKAIAAFEKTAELMPNDFAANFNLGLLIIKKGDAFNAEVRKKPYISPEESQKDIKAVNDIFRKSVAPLEKAYSLNPKDINTVELLKNVCFRLRDEEGMKAKFEKYNEEFKAMKAAAAPAQ